MIPVKFLATVLTIAFGGSVGKEGPAVQMGSGAASALARWLRLDEADRKKVVICGISAGFAAVLGTSFGGAIFGVEVLFVGSIMHAVLLPSIIAGITAHQVTSLFGVSHVNFLYLAENPEIVDGGANFPLFAWSIAAGIFFGLCAILFVEMLDGSETLAARLRVWPPLKAFLGGSALVGLALVFSTQYLGLGMSTVNNLVSGASIVWYAFLLKMVFTVVTLSFGGSGGLVIPLFFIGAAAGSTFASWAGLDPQLFAALGLVAVLAGATNTPLACSIIAIELFGRQIAPYAATVCVISFLITGYRSVYPSQVLAIIKSSSMGAEVGREMMHMVPSYAPRRRSLITALLIRRRIMRRKRAAMKRK